MEPCKQEMNIGMLHATVEGIKESLDKLGEGQTRFIDTLEKIAAQSTKISKLEKDTGELFGRVRQVELVGESQKVKIAGIVALVSVVITALANYLFGQK